MKTYTKQDFHNPEQLTRQQVGNKHRLLLSSELPSARGFFDKIQLILDDDWVIANGDSITVSYRVPLATPLPDGTVLSSNECCWSDQPRKKRVYVAGPMSNMPDYNFPAFYAAAESLERQGYDQVNPADLDCTAGFPLEKIKQLNPAEFQEFLKGAAKRDLDALQQCDAIALLPGWENSKGARAEKAVAEWLGLEVMYLGSKQENCEYCQGPCQSSTPSGCVGADGESGPVDTLSEKAPQISDAKQPYNSDERAEWGGVCITTNPPKFEYSIPNEEADKHTIRFASDDPKGAAGAKKPPMHLLPPNALIETAKAMGHGAAKYGAWNFVETTVCASTYVGALGRHWAAYARSEDIDPDSGLQHLALIAANCFVLLTAQQQGTLRDDRPKLRQI